MRGDLTPAQFRGLANIVREYTGGKARATQEQNIVLRWVPTGYLPAVWQALNELELAEAGHSHITNVVSCPGTDSCKLGITASMGLAKALREEMSGWNGLADDAGVGDIRIKMSGCPNGCGLHHIANIGFHGAAVKGSEGQQIPAYELFLGGNYGDNQVEDSRIGTRVPRVKVPAKLVPSVLKDIVILLQGQPRQRFRGFQLLPGPGWPGRNDLRCRPRPGNRPRSRGRRRDVLRLGTHQPVRAGTRRRRVRRLAAGSQRYG